MACKRCQKKETMEEHWAKRGIKPRPVVKPEVEEVHTDEECEGCSEEK